jgi:hypothetical protein
MNYDFSNKKVAKNFEHICNSTNKEICICCNKIDIIEFIYDIKNKKVVIICNDCYNNSKIINIKNKILKKILITNINDNIYDTDIKEQLFDYIEQVYKKNNKLLNLQNDIEQLINEYKYDYLNDFNNKIKFKLLKNKNYENKEKIQNYLQINENDDTIEKQIINKFYIIKHYTKINNDTDYDDFINNFKIVYTNKKLEEISIVYDKFKFEYYDIIEPQMLSL